VSSRPREHLDPAIFRLPLEQLRSGYCSDACFTSTKKLLDDRGTRAHVTMQVFRAPDGRGPEGSWVDGWPDPRVSALHEGDTVAAAKAFAERFSREQTPSRQRRGG
jgi:hypothetical protein